MFVFSGGGGGEEFREGHPPPSFGEGNNHKKLKHTVDITTNVTISNSGLHEYFWHNSFQLGSNFQVTTFWEHAPSILQPQGTGHLSLNNPGSAPVLRDIDVTQFCGLAIIKMNYL